MAEEKNQENECHDLTSLFSSKQRDYLVRNNGDQVKIDDLKGKTIGIYFSASWCGPCRRFTPKLIQVYNELSAKNDFEIIFTSADRDEEAFNDYFSKMPWLAIPFSDSDVVNSLNELFSVNGIPCLVLLDGSGKFLTDEAVELINDYGADGYPFTAEKIQHFKEEEEKAKKEQTLRSVLVSPSRDFLISNDGNQVQVSELEGKIVGLYFSSSVYGPCVEFTQRLAEVYSQLNERGDSFKVVLISLDEDEEIFKESMKGMPWLALPFKDNSCSKLIRHFDLSTLPTLVIIGSDGKTLLPNAADLIEEFGIQAFPFTPEKLVELEEIKKAKLESQTLESLLVSGDKDFVIAKDGTKVPVSELVGKNILLSFSAHWCPPCRAFLPKLIEVYNEIKAKDDAFEVIFISSDRDQASFDDYFSSMPWLALPFGDERKQSLSRTFNVRGIPTLIAIGPTGRTVSEDARGLLMTHGAKAYPFTDERLKDIETELEETVKGWPEKVKHELHKEHELLLCRRSIYTCDGCEEVGNAYSYNCEECDFDLHPKCALKDGDEGKEDAVEKVKSEDASKSEWTCDGEVCTKRT